MLYSMKFGIFFIFFIFFCNFDTSYSTAGREGTFTTWMLQESDLIQMAARGFGDNLIAER